MSERIRVVGALIKNNRNEFLICQRPENKKRGLLWEFPGGKIEAGETPQEALIRECQEELGITVRPGSLFDSIKYDYPDILIELQIYQAQTPENEDLTLKEHRDARFIGIDEVENYRFCPADYPILEKLSRNSHN